MLCTFVCVIIVFFAVFVLFVVVGTTPVVPLVAGNETMQYSSCFFLRNKGGNWFWKEFPKKSISFQLTAGKIMDQQKQSTAHVWNW